MQLHTGKFSYFCDECKKGFNCKGPYKEHILWHQMLASGKIKKISRPFSCRRCDKRFTASSSLSRHMQIHTQQFRYNCVTCGKGFVQRQELTEHLNKHIGRSFPCQFCSSRFAFEKALKSHMRKVHGDVPNEG